jgi:peroxiredoxin
MKLALLSTLLLTQIAILAEVQPGKPAPDFSVKDINGQTHKLSDYKGKMVVLENYNPECPFVANQYGKGGMQHAQAEATQKGAVWLVVNSTYGDASSLKKQVEKQSVKGTAIVHDPEGKIGKTYGFKTTPHLFVVDKEGKVAYSGAIDDKADADHDPRKARNYVLEAIDKLAAGQPVAVASTKPYGCGAKYAK